MRRKGNRCCALFPKQGSDSRCGAGRQAAGHQQGGGLQDELHILAHIGHAGHVLPVQLLKGVRHVLTELLPTKGAGGQILLQIGPQVRLILVVAEHTVGIILVMGIGERIRQIVGQFAQGVILPDGPALAALEPGDAGVDVVLGAEQKGELLQYLGDLQKHEKGEAITTTTKDIRSFSPSCSRGDRTRFFLKVQDGCDYFCSYCTIPFARGRSRNGTIASMVEQARQAAAEGGKEIVLTGVNIGDFGKTTGESFFDLVKALDQVEGIERYRISSIEPNLLTDAIIEFVSHSRSFMPHFHIPLQSGCDEVLQLMRRRYDTALFASKVRKIKEVMPDAFIGVDVIVGTRGETPEYFEQAYQFIDGLDVTQLHVFSYSERPGTQALKIEYVVSPEEKHQRSQRLLTLSDQKTQAFYARHIGQVMPVLMEKSKTGVPMHGFTENYIRVEVENDDSLDNRVVNVRLGDFNEERTALKSTILI